MPSYLLAIDQGTTGTTTIVLDEQLAVLATVNHEFPQIFPRPGLVEHDPEAIWKSVVDTVREAIERAGIDPNAIAGIGITNQRETTVVWERDTGRAIHNAIVWQDRRTEDRCRALREEGLAPRIAEKTGLVVDPYFSGTKLAWILKHTDSQERAARGELAFGTIDSFVCWRLTGGEAHVTDVSNASRTMLFDIAQLRWDPELLELFDVPTALLPQVRGNAEIYGRTRGVRGLPDGIPVAGMAGDQQAALFGQACFAPGAAKCTYGTGSFMLMNTGSELVRSRNGMLTTVAWQLGDGPATYALEGATFIAGAIVQWLRDGLQMIRSAAEIESLAGQVEDSGGVVLVPSLTGLGAPHWKAEARGVIWGLSRGTTRGHLARAALEGIAHQNTDVLEAMSQDLGRSLTELKVDGGAAQNDLLMQIQADLLGTTLVRPQNLQTTALGSALLAGLAVGMFADLEAVARAWREERSFTPIANPQLRWRMRELWREGVSRV